MKTDKEAVWPHLDGPFDGSRYTPSSISPNVKLIWKKKIPSKGGDCSYVGSYGRVFAIAKQKDILALELTTGNTLWCCEDVVESIGWNTCVWEDVVVVDSGSDPSWLLIDVSTGDISANLYDVNGDIFDISNSKIIWTELSEYDLVKRQVLHRKNLGQPTIEYFGRKHKTCDGYHHAFVEKRMGDLVYVKDVDAIKQDAPGFLFCWDLNLGKTIWEVYGGFGPGWGSIRYISNEVLVCTQIISTSDQGKNVPVQQALNPITGELFWQRPFLDRTAVSGDYMISADRFSKLECLNVKTGETLWTENVKGKRGSEPLATPDHFWIVHSVTDVGSKCVSYLRAFKIESGVQDAEIEIVTTKPFELSWLGAVDNCLILPYKNALYCFGEA